MKIQAFINVGRFMSNTKSHNIAFSNLIGHFGSLWDVESERVLDVSKGFVFNYIQMRSK